MTEKSWQMDGIFYEYGVYRDTATDDPRQIAVVPVFATAAVWLFMVSSHWLYALCALTYIDVLHRQTEKYADNRDRSVSHRFPVMTAHRHYTNHQQLLDTALQSDGSNSTDTQPGAVDDLAFLTRSEHRIDALSALTERPQSRADLRVVTEASSATVGRILRGFEERNWIVRDGYQYELTPLGVFVAEEFLRLIERMETERKLRRVTQWLPTERIDFDPTSFVDATVSVPEPGDPYRPISRFIELMTESGTLRGFGTTLGTVSVETVLRNVNSGMQSEIIYPPDVAEVVLAANVEDVTKAVESGNLTLRLAEDLPCGFALFDDHVALGGYDHSGILRITIDTDAPRALDWAESLYETYRHTSVPLHLPVSCCEGVPA